MGFGDGKKQLWLIGTGGINRLLAALCLFAFTVSFPWRAGAFTLISSVTINGPNNSFEGALSLVPAADGNVFVAGQIAVPSQDRNIWVAKFSPEMVQVASYTFNGSSSGYDSVSKITCDRNGDLLLGGSVTENSGATNLWVGKFDTGLGFKSSVTLSGWGNYTDSGNTVAADADNNVWLGGYTLQNLNYDAVTAKYTPSLVLISSRGVNGPSNSNDEVLDLAPGPDGNMYSAGYITEPAGLSNIWLVKYNSSMVMQSSAVFNGSANSSDSARKLAIDAAGNVWVAGTVNEVSGGYNIFIAKYNSALVLQASTTVSGSAGAADVAYGLAFDPWGNVLATGYVNQTAGGINIWIGKYAQSLALISSMTVNGSANGSDYGYAIASDPDGNVWVAGNVTESVGGANIWVAKYASGVSPPPAAITVPGDTAHKNALPVIYGTLYNPVSISSVQVYAQRLSDNYYWDPAIPGFVPQRTWLDCVLFPSSWSYSGAIPWTDGASYRVAARAANLAGDWSAAYSTSTFYFDTSLPVSSVTVPQNGEVLYSVLPVSGTAYDAGGLLQINVRIQRASDNKYWAGTSLGWVPSETWNPAQGTLTWGYSALIVDYMTVETTYTVAAQALDLAGNSEPVGSSISFLYSVDNAAPDAVSGLTASQGASTNTITLRWTSPGNNGTSGTLPAGSEYRVQYTTAPWTVVWSTASAQLGIPASGIVPGTQISTSPAFLWNGIYYFRVWTVDGSSNWSAPSAVASSYNSPFSIGTIAGTYGSPVGEYTSIAVDRANNLHVSYMDGVFDVPRYIKRTGLVWGAAQIVDNGSFLGRYTSVAIDGNGLPWYSYRSAVNGDLKYARSDGSSWTPATIETASDSTWTGNSMCLDGLNRAHTSYYAGWPGYDLKYAMFDGSTWRFTLLDTAGTVGDHSSLALDGAGNPAISYYNTTAGDLKCARFNGVSWSTYTLDSAGTVGLYTSMAMDGAGNPAISYYDQTNGDLKFARYNGTAWSTATVENAGDVGAFSSLALDGAGNPHIAYFDSTNSDLKYARFDGTAWSTMTVDSYLCAGQWTSLALDSSGTVSISYYDCEFDRRDLKAAHFSGGFPAPMGGNSRGRVQSPSGFSGIALSSSSISFNWKDNSANETGFAIYGGTSPAGPFSLVPGGAAPAGQTTFTETGLTGGTTYYRYVGAVNAGGVAVSSFAVVVTNPAFADLVRPTVHISSPVGPVTSDYVQQIRGTAWDDVSVSSVQISIRRQSDGYYWDGVSFGSAAYWLDSAFSLAASSWTYYAVPRWVSGSTYTIVARAADVSGNWSLNYATSVFHYAPDFPSGCLQGYSVKQDGSRDYVTIQGALDALPRVLTSDLCVVVRDTQTYAEQVTVQGFVNNGYRVRLMADPTFTSSSPVVSPPAGSTAAFVIANASATVAGFAIVPSVAALKYGVFISSFNVSISSVNVTDIGGLIWGAGVSLGSRSSVTNSMISLQNAYGFYMSSVTGVSLYYSTVQVNAAGWAALFMSGSSSNSVVSVYARNMAGTGVLLSAGSNWNSMENSHFAAGVSAGSNGSDALYITGSSTNSIYASVLVGGPGIGTAGSGTAAGNGLRVSGGYTNQVIQSSMAGGVGGPYTGSSPSGGGAGGYGALIQNDSRFLVISFSTMTGGMGGDGAWSGGGVGYTNYSGGSGGSGLQVDGSYYGVFNGNFMTGGNGGANISGAAGNGGVGLVLNGGGGHTVFQDRVSGGPGRNSSTGLYTVGGSGGHAMSLSGSSSNLISQSLFTGRVGGNGYVAGNGGHGLYVQAGGNANTVTQCSLTSGAGGNGADSGLNMFLNKAGTGGHGLYVVGSSSNTVVQSSMSAAAGGVNVPGTPGAGGSAALLQDGGNYNTVSFSTMTGGGGAYGLALLRSRYNGVFNCGVYGSTAALISGSTGSVVGASVIVSTGQNGSGLWFGDGSSGLTLSSSSLAGGPQGAGVWLASYNSGWINLSTGSINGGRYGAVVSTQVGTGLAFTGLNFDSLSPGATAIEFLGGSYVSTFTGLGFNSANIAVNVDGAALASGSSIVIHNSTGPRNGYAFENDPYGYVHWDELPAPAAVGDLAVVPVSSAGLRLSWSAPGEDGVTGTLNGALFAVQYATHSAAAWDYGNAQLIISTGGVVPGSVRYYHLGGLTANTSYYFCLWTRDATVNYSSASNAAVSATYVEAPVGIYFDEILSTAIVASAYAPTPAFHNLHLGLSGTNVAVNTNTWTWAGWHGEKWTAKAPMPTARWMLSAAAAAGKIYAIGGGNGDYLGVNEQYNPGSDSWTAKAPMPTVRSGLASTALGGKIYAQGGYGHVSGMTANEEYSPTSDTWGSRAVIPTGRESAGAAAVDDRIYLLGGYARPSEYFAINEAYSPSSNLWLSMANMPTVRGFFAAGNIGGKVYAVGGNSANKNENEAYDPATNTWVSRATLPTPRLQLAGGVIGGKLYAVGGVTASATFNTVEEYDPVSDAWASKTSMPTPRGYLAAAVTGGKLYALGGYTDADGYLDDNEEYDPGVAGVFSGLAPNTLYTFKAKARSQNGVESAESPQVSTYTLANPPSALDYSAYVTSCALTWALNDNPTGTIAEVARSSDNALFSAIYSGAAQAFMDTGLQPDSTYYYRVRNINHAGVRTAFSATGAVHTLPAVPGALSAPPVGSALGVSSISWTWGALSRVSGYKVYPATAPTEQLAVAAGPVYVRTGLLPNTTYAIMAAGFNVTGIGPLSAPSAAVATLANPPSGLAVTGVFAASATLAWGLNGNPPGVSARVRLAEGGVAVATTALSYTYPGLLSCTSYYFRVWNVNMDNVPTAYSQVGPVFTAPGPAPLPPGNLSAHSLEGGRIVLTWEPAPFADMGGYNLYYDNGSGSINYSARLAGLGASETYYVTGVLPAGTVYKFGLRSVSRCGVEEDNTSVTAAAASVNSLASVRAAIKIPQTGKRISGNSVTVMAELVSGLAADTYQVRFQYKPSASSTWLALPAADPTNHPNPDPAPPYFVHWNVVAVAAGNYDLRAVATDRYGNTDPFPSAVTVTVNDSGADITENVSGGKITKEQVVNNLVTNTVQAGDANSSQVVRVEIPSGALDASTATVAATNDPSAAPAVPGDLQAAGICAEIRLSSQSALAGTQPALVTLFFPDVDNDGIVDGTDIQARRLEMYSSHSSAGPWTRDLSSEVDLANKKVIGRTTHFSYFALFVPLATNITSARAYPVPWKPGTGGRFDSPAGVDGIIFEGLTDNAVIRIYTITGQLVRELKLSASDLGQKVWDGRNEAGKKAGSGVYLAHIKAGHSVKILKVAVER